MLDLLVLWHGDHWRLLIRPNELQLCIRRQLLAVLTRNYYILSTLTLVSNLMIFICLLFILENKSVQIVKLGACTTNLSLHIILDSYWCLLILIIIVLRTIILFWLLLVLLVMVIDHVHRRPTNLTVVSLIVHNHLIHAL